MLILLPCLFCVSFTLWLTLLTLLQLTDVLVCEETTVTPVTTGDWEVTPKEVSN